MSGKVVSNKGSLDREGLVTKALKFPSRTRKSFVFVFWSDSELKQRVQLQDRMYTRRQGDRFGGRVLSKQNKKREKQRWLF